MLIYLLSVCYYTIFAIIFSWVRHIASLWMIYFQSLLTDEQVASAPVLVLGNKIDKAGAASEDEIRHWLGLHGQTTGKVRRLTAKKARLQSLEIGKQKNYKIENKIEKIFQVTLTLIFISLMKWMSRINFFFNMCSSFNWKLIFADFWMIWWNLWVYESIISKRYFIFFLSTGNCAQEWAAWSSNGIIHV